MIDPASCDVQRAMELQRREFLTTTASGLGGLALGSLLSADGVSAASSGSNPLAPRSSHFPARAKNCIFCFQAGAPSHIDLFDPKPKLNELHGQPLPASMTENVRFAFIKKETAILMGSNRKFTRHGACGMELSDLLPHLGSVADDLLLVRSMHTDQFNHHPGQLLMQCGRADFGLPSMGSWLTYGLGSENSNLPSYVVMHGTKPRGGDPIWSSGFLPSVYQATALDPRGKKPIDNLERPKELTGEQQRSLLDTLKAANAKHAKKRPFDRDLNARLESFELAYRMQTSAPEAFDLAQEPQHIQEMYGLNRNESKDYGRQCLIARRLIERGVRFVQIFAACPSTPGGAVSDVPWDAHSDIKLNHSTVASTVDQPTAALLSDLKQRGLFDETIVIYGGEFGRTSDSQGSAGRDHNPNAFTTWFAGGGFKGGTQYGASDEFGYKSVENRVNAHDIHATVLHQMGIDHTKLTYRFNGRDFRLTDVEGEILREILA